MQELEDIRTESGLSIFSMWKSVIKKSKEEGRQKLRESAIRCLENKLIENEYESLKEFSADWRHVDKWLGEEWIAELE